MVNKALVRGKKFNKRNVISELSNLSSIQNHNFKQKGKQRHINKTLNIVFVRGRNKFNQRNVFEDTNHFNLQLLLF
jgi:hypothetical protein